MRGVTVLCFCQLMLSCLKCLLLLVAFRLVLQVPDFDIRLLQAQGNASEAQSY